MQVEVVRSSRRRKTVELRPIPGGVRISIPASATKAEEEKYVKQLLQRYQKRKEVDEIDLTERARVLAARYRLPTPVQIRWVENQTSRWGSCTPSTGHIRISHAVAKFPGWVIDSVIVHELAHLEILDHSPAFWALANRYELMERARGFLIAKGLDGESDANHDDSDQDASEDLDADIDLTDGADEPASGETGAGDLRLF